MQTVSDLYRNIIADKRHRKEVKILVDGVDHQMGNILSLKTYGSLFKTVGIGNVISREIDLSFVPIGEIPRKAEIRPYIRVRLGDQVSEWVQKGVFYIDTRKFDDASGTLTVHGYDAMLKSSPNYIDVEESSGTWPRKARTVVEDIAYRMGVELDERTVLQEYDVGYMPLTSGRETLGWIAAMHGGNWTITDEGKLRLVPLVTAWESIDLGREMAQLETALEFAPYTGVQFYYEDKDTIFAGTDEGRVLEVECPWATQEIANAVLDNIRGYIYRPYKAVSAILDPAAELGDPITVSGTDSVLASCDTTFNAIMVSDIAAPADKEIDHEYPYEDPNRNRTRRGIARAKADIQIGVDNIQAKVEGVEGGLAQLKLEVDGITLEVTSVSTTGGQTYARIRLKGGNGEWQEGQILLNGNVNVSGTLSAEALYAALGDVANLMVNRLSTSRRIPKYLAGDTSDDRYFYIANEEQRMVRAWTDGATEQARTPDGALLYWEQDVSDATLGANGYPYIDGVQVPTTTTESPYPVMVYVYQEGDRWKQTFAKDGNYAPQQIWGEGYGDASDPDRGKGFIQKLGASFEFLLKNSLGKYNGLVVRDDYTEVKGVRKTVKVDLSNLYNGSIVFTLEGDYQVKFDVELDENGLPFKYINADGNVMEVTYPSE